MDDTEGNLKGLTAVMVSYFEPDIVKIGVQVSDERCIMDDIICGINLNLVSCYFPRFLSVYLSGI